MGAKPRLTTPFEGVNLGGWLLVERWMTPSLFKGTNAQDEYSLMKMPDGAARIAQHRNAFITEEDWQWLADNHVTHVRLPVGYWVLRDDAPYTNAKKQLDWAFRMAEKHNINILLDLHALKGSQNGTIHSGRVGSVHWIEYSHESLETIKQLALRYGDSTSLWGIEIINEPKVLGNYIALKRFYRDAYAMLRTILRPGVYTVFQDGFLPMLFSGTLRADADHPVIMDTHFYLIHPKVLSRLSPSSYDRVRSVLYGWILKHTMRKQPIIVGEWSSVLPQAMFNREPATEHLDMVGATIERQRHSYRHAFGTFYWNYKTEGTGMYNYRSLIDSNVIRRD